MDLKTIIYNIMSDYLLLFNNIYNYIDITTCTYILIGYNIYNAMGKSHDIYSLQQFESETLKYFTMGFYYLYSN